MTTSHTSSGQYTIVSMPEEFQEFLRKYYDCYDEVFSFGRASRTNWLPTILRECLWLPPEGYHPLRDSDFRERTFKIHINSDKYRDPNTYFYVSPLANKELVKQVDLFVYTRFAEDMSELRSMGLKRNFSVARFMERYEISEEHREAFERFYTRFINRVYKETHKAKKKA